MIPESISQIIGFESAAHAKVMDSGVGINATKFNSYSDAATRWAEIAIGFAEWKEENTHRWKANNLWYVGRDYQLKMSVPENGKTDSELLIYYINNVFNKK